MNFQIEFSEKAFNDIKGAFDWYEGQKQGLGERFAAAVDAALKPLTINPFLPQILTRGLRKVKPKRFPYGIYYRVSDDYVVKVIGVIHLKRHPRVITKLAKS